MTRNLAFSYHPDAFDTDDQGTVIPPGTRQSRAPWPFVVDAILTHAHVGTAKGDIPAFIPVAWKPGAPTKEREHVDSVHFLCADFDESLSLERLEALKEKVADVDSCIYLTHGAYKHYRKCGEVKARMILPLQKPIPVANWRTFFEKARAYFDGWVFDTKCKNPNRVYYTPGYPSPEAQAFAAQHVQVVMHRGYFDNALIEAMPYVKRAGPLDVPDVDKTPLPVIETALRREAKALQRSKGKRRTLGLALESLLSGHPYSDEGARHDMMIQLTWHIATQHPVADPDKLARMFDASHDAMNHIHETPSDDLKAVAEAIRTAQVKIRDTLASKTDSESRRAAYMNAEAGGQLDPEYRYSEDDRRAIAVMLGIEHADLDSHWIMVSPNAKEFYLPTLKGVHTYFNAPEIYSAVSGLLAPTGIRLHTVGGTERNPRKMLRPLKEITEEYGMTIDKTIYDNRLHNSYRVEKRALTLPCPRADLTPEFVPEAEKYLKAMFGENYPKAEAWLSWFPDTTKLLCALFLTGPKGIGKSFLATSLSHLWPDPPVMFEQAMGRFNFDMVKTPLIWADEWLPPGAAVSSALRTITGNREFYVEKKYGGIYTARGARRLIVTLNSAQSLRFKDVLEKDDLEALNERIWICVGSAQGRVYLLDIGEKRREYLNEQGIAQHVLWLAENRRPAWDGKNRFVVSGSDDMSANLVLADPSAQKIFTILQKIMDDANNRAKNTVLKSTGWGDGNLFLSTQDLNNAWDEHNFREEKWTQPNVHLKKIGSIRRIGGRGESRPRTCMVNTALFYEFLENYAGVDSAPYRAMVDHKESKHHLRVVQ